MAEIRLSKLAKQFNIGLNTLVDFLNSIGVGVESVNPNIKISDEYIPELCKEFGEDQKNKVIAESVNFKMADIISRESYTCCPKRGNRLLGVLKFYDSQKGFGFIASNNLGTNLTIYEQDFYVNSESFSTSTAKKEKSIVVFQYEHKNGRVHAINVRPFTRTEEDFILATNYYGAYEMVKMDNTFVNMFNYCKVPRKYLLPKVKDVLLSNKNRTPETTLSVIKHFIDKYKVVLEPNGKRYVFSRDFDTELKNEWEELFKLISADEWIPILNQYPPAIIYVNDDEIICNWLNQLSPQIYNENSCENLAYIKPLLPECEQITLTAKIKDAAENEVLKIIEHYKKQENILSDVSYNFKLEIATILEEENNLDYFDYNITKYDLEENLKPYLKFTNRNFDAEIKECLDYIALKKFHNALDVFSEKRDAIARKTLLIQYRELPEKEKHKQEVTDSLSLILQEYSKANKLEETLGYIEYAREFDKTFGEPFVEKMSSQIEKRLQQDLSEALLKESVSFFENTFEKNYSYYTSLCNKDFTSILWKKFASQIQNSNSIDILISATDSKHAWISTDTVTRRYSEIVNSWQYKDIKNFITSTKKNIPPTLGEFIFLRSIKIISNYKTLSVPFDSTFIVENQKYHSNVPLLENIDFLKTILNYCYTENSKACWESYISSLGSGDLIVLYKKGILKKLPGDIVESIIQDITLDCTSTPPNLWYSVPFFANENIESILSNSNIDIFTPIANVLRKATIEQHNIALYVWLTELLAFNKPYFDEEYKEDREQKRIWESSFNKKILDFQESIPNNPRLLIILWAVYFQTRAPRTTLSEVYAWLPPYLQIKIVKKLFNLISRGRLIFSAQTMYSFLSSKREKLCLPVEIVFSYLILRENNPLANFDNSKMLSLIENRNDHSEWVQIREFVERCNGRYDVKSYWDNHFYNGLLKISSETVCLFLPFRMIDSSGVIQKYHNKYFEQITEQILFNFKKTDYAIRELSNGNEYYFKNDSVNYLLLLIRDFNIYKSTPYPHSKYEFKIEKSSEFFCECRLANKRSSYEDMPFYWCENKQCFRPAVRMHSDKEWESYTILDFMRILQLPIDYTNKNGVVTKYGYYIIFTAFLKKFIKFYEHLKCRKCGKLLHPLTVSNFAYDAVSEFVCNNENCELKDMVIYLNHCFNKEKCSEIIDSRDSKKCPNGQYICPACGACCSTENFEIRIAHLTESGGRISPWIRNFVANNLGHWERNEFYCHRCGALKQNGECPHCCQLKGVRDSSEAINDLPF